MRLWHDDALFDKSSLLVSNFILMTFNVWFQTDATLTPVDAKRKKALHEILEGLLEAFEQIED